MTQKLTRWTFEGLFGLLAISLAAMAGGVAYVQHKDGQALAELAKFQQRRIIPLPGRPGDIYARTRSGQVLLASSNQVAGCYADPKLLGEDQFGPVAEKIATLTGSDAAEIYRQLKQRKDRQYAPLLHDLSDGQADAIRKLDMQAVQVAHEWRRHYPNGPLAAQVVGFRRIDGEAGAGLELQADKWLKAQDGLKILRCDAARKNHYVELDSYEPPKDGSHVMLTIDVTIQGYLERAIADSAEQFGAKAVMGCVMDPNTGEVLAMASWPSFDPNLYNQATPDQLRLRVLTDPYEPGSSYKPFIAVGALQLGKATLSSQFFCHNGMWVAPRGGIIRDAPGEHFGMLPLTDIVIHSSNVGMAELGAMLGNRLLYAISSAFGFGSMSGIELPGECPGKLAPVRRWTSYDTYRLPFGQGQIMVTTLQLCNAFSTIANGGTLMKPRLIDRVVSPDGKVLYQGSPQKVRQVLTPTVARQFIDEALVQVVEKGTGKKARMARWYCFGKTGTAQIGGPHGYQDRAFTGTFVGGAPASKPRVVCVISVYHPTRNGHYGGTVAAPYVKEVLEKTLSYLDVPPDRVDELVQDAPRPAVTAGPEE